MPPPKHTHEGAHTDKHSVAHQGALTLLFISLQLFVLRGGFGAMRVPAEQRGCSSVATPTGTITGAARANSGQGKEAEEEEEVQELGQAVWVSRPRDGG